MSRFLLFILVGFNFSCTTPAASRELASAANDQTTVEWPSYAGDQAATKFSRARLINQKNVAQLKVAWIWKSVDNPLVKEKDLHTSYNETTPLMVNGRVYVSTLLNQVAALDPATGKTIWSYDPHVYDSYPGNNSVPVNQSYVQRGLAFRLIDGKPRLFLNTNDGRLIQLDADSGKVIVSFGKKGEVILRETLTRGKANVRNYGNTSPALICKNTVITGSSILDMPFRKNGRPPGDVQGFDLRTGRLKWTFHTVPQAGEFGVKTWEKDSWKVTGNTNVWAPMSSDENAGVAFLPVTTPSNDFYGGGRPGNGLFGESVVSLDCETGKRLWHYQLVHHGLWDYDPPTPPILFDVPIDGRLRKIAVQVTKQAFAYVFDRETGEPIWPFEERAVPKSDVPGEKASPTQPFPTKPLPFDRQGATVENLIDFTPELREQAKKIFADHVTGPLYTPPSLKGTISLPGVVGGASWAGAAYSPETQTLYIPSITKPAEHKLLKEPSILGSYKYVKNPLIRAVDGPQGLPLFKPPYGRITAIDMKTGEQRWMRPIGRGPKDHDALRNLNIKGDLGWARRIFVLATPDLIFAAQEGLTKIVNVASDLNAPVFEIKDSEAFLRALDPETGEMRAEIPMPVNAFGSPMTYVTGGKQFIVMPFGGANLESGLIAYALP